MPEHDADGAPRDGLASAAARFARRVVLEEQCLRGSLRLARPVASPLASGLFMH
jgi:hypothetical protein